MSLIHSPFEAMHAAILVAGSQSALARICHVSQPAVNGWVKGKRSLPAEHVLVVEAATGISKHDLRPDIYPREIIAAGDLANPRLEAAR